ncbi:MAG: hypothetical protein U0232_11550 [Thermomicrobiales bacterium]
MVETLLRVAGTAILGVLLGFFVAVSGFADGQPGERAVVIGVIVIAYAITGLGLGYRATLWYGLGLAVPGVAVLLLYVANDDGSGWYLPYAGAIAALALGGAYLGVRLGQRRA